MCGIAGFIQSQRSNININYNVVASEMARAIQHRGPDNKGVWFDNVLKVAMAYQRLAVLDLTENGNQPMKSQSGRWIIVYNGEIYNHLQLRKDLVDAGFKVAWKGFSDTETLLACIDFWGIEKSLSKITGMFAFAIWDNKNKKLYLARDRFGEKPLYYGLINNHFVFASEIKSFKNFPGFKKKIDSESLHDYFSLNVVPNHRCIYKGIFKLPAGTFLQVHSGLIENQNFQPKEYWSIKKIITSHEDNQTLPSEHEINQTTEKLIRNSVKQQLLSDVPIGIFLSGGIDSSVIATLASQVSSQQVKTFSIGFKEKDYDESKIARKISDILKTDHTNYELSSEEAITYIKKMGSTFDEPFADSSQIPMKLICELARKNITVALTGDGGDEIFGGYNRHILSNQYWPKIKILPKIIRKIIFFMSSPFYTSFSSISRPKDKLSKIKEIINSNDDNDFYNNLLSNNFDTNKFLNTNKKQKSFLYNLPEFENKKLNISEQLMLADLSNYLKDDILVKSDRSSMSVGLEIRSPFLDHRIFEFYSKVPFNYKVNKNVGKITLKNILTQSLPHDLIERPKMGFSIPLNTWLRGPLKNWAQDLLSSESLSRCEFINSKSVIKIWNDYIGKKKGNVNLIWSLLMYLEWLNNQ